VRRPPSCRRRARPEDHPGRNGRPLLPSNSQRVFPRVLAGASLRHPTRRPPCRSSGVARETGRGAHAALIVLPSSGFRLSVLSLATGTCSNTPRVCAARQPSCPRLAVLPLEPTAENGQSSRDVTRMTGASRCSNRSSIHPRPNLPRRASFFTFLVHTASVSSSRADASNRALVHGASRRSITSNLAPPSTAARPPRATHHLPWRRSDICVPALRASRGSLPASHDSRCLPAPAFARR